MRHFLGVVSFIYWPLTLSFYHSKLHHRHISRFCIVSFCPYLSSPSCPFHPCPSYPPCHSCPSCPFHPCPSYPSCPPCPSNTSCPIHLCPLDPSCPSSPSCPICPCPLYRPCPSRPSLRSALLRFVLNPVRLSFLSVSLLWFCSGVFIPRALKRVEYSYR